MADSFLILQAICEACGERVELPEFESVRGGYDTEVGIWRPLGGTPPSFPVPFDAEGGCSVGFIPRSRITEAYIAELEEQLPDSDEVEINRGRYAFRELLESMVGEGADLVAIRV